jgi:hypothetical protein
MEVKMRSLLVGMLATLAAFAVAAPVQAQNSSIDGTLAPNRSVTRQKQSNPTRQKTPRSDTSAARTRQATTPAPTATALQPAHSRDNPREITPLDPVKLDQNLRLGLETSSKVNTYRFEDGRRIPGLENTTRNEPSYFGLSVSVPTRGNGLLPPLLPRPE